MVRIKSDDRTNYGNVACGSHIFQGGKNAKYIGGR